MRQYPPRDQCMNEDATILADLWAKFSAAWDQAQRDAAGEASITYNPKDRDEFVAYMILTTREFKRANDSDTLDFVGEVGAKVRA